MKPATDKRTGLRLLPFSPALKARIKKTLESESQAKRSKKLAKLDTAKLTVNLAQALAMARHDAIVIREVVDQAIGIVVEHKGKYESILAVLIADQPAAVAAFSALEGDLQNPRALDIGNFPNRDKTALANRATLCTRETVDKKTGQIVRRRVKCETALGDIKKFNKPGASSDVHGFWGLPAIIAAPGHDSQTQVQAHYALVPLKHLALSHQVTGARNTKFDEHLVDPLFAGKPPEAIAQLTKPWFAPYVLSDDITTQGGPPVIDSQWRVLSQTPAVLGLLASMSSPHFVSQYAFDMRRALESHALQWGLSPLSALGDIEKYIVVRVVKDDFDAKAHAGTLNSGWTSAQDMPCDGVSCPANRSVPTELLVLLATRLAERPCEGLAQVMSGCSRVVQMLEHAGWIDADINNNLDISNRARWVRNTLQGHELTPNAVEALCRCIMGDLFADRLAIAQWGAGDLAKIKRVSPATLLTCQLQSGVARPVREAIKLFGRMCVAQSASEMLALEKQVEKAFGGKTGTRLKACFVAWFCSKEPNQTGQALALSRAVGLEAQERSLVLPANPMEQIRERFKIVAPVPTVASDMTKAQSEAYADAVESGAAAPIQAPERAAHIYEGSVSKAKLGEVSVKRSGDLISIVVPNDKKLQKINKAAFASIKAKLDHSGEYWVADQKHKETAEKILDDVYGHHGTKTKLTDLLFEITHGRGEFKLLTIDPIGRTFMGHDRLTDATAAERVVIARHNTKEPPQLGPLVTLVSGDLSPKGKSIGSVGAVLRINQVPLPLAEHIVTAGRASFAPPPEVKEKRKRAESTELDADVEGDILLAEAAAVAQAPSLPTPVAYVPEPSPPAPVTQPTIEPVREAKVWREEPEEDWSEFLEEAEEEETPKPRASYVPPVVSHTTSPGSFMPTEMPTPMPIAETSSEPVRAPAPIPTPTPAPAPIIQSPQMSMEDMLKLMNASDEASTQRSADALEKMLNRI